MSDNQSNKKWYEPALAWFVLYGDKIIKAALDNGGSYLASKVGGFWGKVVLLAFKWIVVPLFKRGLKYIENKREAKKELDKLNEVLNDPSKTNEDIIKAEDDFFDRP